MVAQRQILAVSDESHSEPGLHMAPYGPGIIAATVTSMSNDQLLFAVSADLV